jgi:hypothetical protein
VDVLNYRERYYLLDTPAKVEWANKHVESAHEWRVGDHCDVSRVCLSTNVIRFEYERTHGELSAVTLNDFAPEDLALSLDDFSRKQGWMS